MEPEGSLPYSQPTALKTCSWKKTRLTAGIVHTASLFLCVTEMKCGVLHDEDTFVY